MSRSRSINSPHVVFPGALGVTATHADAIRFNATIGAPNNPQEGDVWWDPVARTLSLQTSEGDVVLQVGQEQHVRVINKSGADIDNGQLVYVSGADSGLPSIELAIADGSITTDVTLGFATHDIPADHDGIITSFGFVHDLDTSACIPGDKIFLDPDTPGDWTKTEPIAPDQIALVGYVLSASEDEGIVFCRVQFTDPETHSLPLVSTDPSAFTTWFLGHYDEIAAGQAIPQGTPYTSADEMCNSEAAFDLTVVSDPLTLRIDGDSVSEATGAITAADFETIEVTAAGRYRSSKKWVGKPDFSVVEIGESVTATIYKTRYWDSGNQDFRILGFRWEFTPSNPAWSFEYWIYRVEIDGSLTELEHKAFNNSDSPLWAANGEKGTFKRTTLEHDFAASEQEGLIVKIDNANVRYLYGDIKYTHI